MTFSFEADNGQSPIAVVAVFVVQVVLEAVEAAAVVVQIS
jgi:hypothetical protein